MNTYIVNHCTGGFIYQLSHKQYTNPFIWSLIDFESMASLVTSFHRINFSRFKLVSDLFHEPVIEIDNCVKVTYPHIKFDGHASNPRINGVDVFTNKPGMYAMDKYLIRTKRMFSSSYQPVFIISEDAPYRKEAISLDKLLQCISLIKQNGTQFPCYVFTHSKNIRDFVECNDIKYVFTSVGGACPFAKYLIDNNFITL